MIKFQIHLPCQKNKNRLSVDLISSHFHHFRVLYTPDSHQVGKMRTDYRLRVSYIVIYSRFQAKCPCGFRRCLLLHSPYLRYSDFTLRVLSGYIFQQHNRIVSQCVQLFCFFTLLILLTYHIPKICCSKSLPMSLLDDEVALVILPPFEWVRYIAILFSHTAVLLNLIILTS